MVWTSDNLPTSYKELNRLISISRTIDSEPTIPPFYKNDKFKRNANINFSYSDKEVKNLTYCSYNTSYFLDLFYNNINKKPYQHQYDILNIQDKVNVIIKSRQIGITDALLLKALHQAFFLKKATCFLTTNTSNAYARLISIYDNMPFYLKKGILNIEDNKILFENHSSITIHKVVSSTRFCPQTSYDNIYLDDFSLYEESISWTNLILNISVRSNSSLIIASSASHSDSLLYKLVNNYKTYNISYESLHPNGTFKEDMIDLIGIKRFASEYENLFEGTKEYNRYINLVSLFE